MAPCYLLSPYCPEACCSSITFICIGSMHGAYVSEARPQRLACNFGPEIWILLEFSSSEPDSQIWNRSSSLKNLKFVFKFIFHWTIQEFSWNLMKCIGNSKKFLGISMTFLEFSRHFFEIPWNFLEIPRNVLEIPRHFLEIPRYFLEIARNWLVFPGFCRSLRMGLSARKP